MIDRLTYDERKVMRHTLGLDQSDEAYRNYYVAPPGHASEHTLNGLVRRGYMVRETSAISPDATYRVTAEGRIAMKGPRP